MSQQMHFEEEPREYQMAYTPALEEHRTEMPGQKISSTSKKAGKSPSPGQRLALAIVSMAVLICAVAPLLGSSAYTTFELVIRLVGVIVVCTAVCVINVVFSWRR